MECLKYAGGATPKSQIDAQDDAPDGGDLQPPAPGAEEPADPGHRCAALAWAQGPQGAGSPGRRVKGGGGALPRARLPGRRGSRRAPPAQPGLPASPWPARGAQAPGDIPALAAAGVAWPQLPQFPAPHLARRRERRGGPAAARG
jgi:hypothetical protein